MDDSQNSQNQHSIDQEQNEELADVYQSQQQMDDSRDSIDVDDSSSIDDIDAYAKKKGQNPPKPNKINQKTTKSQPEGESKLVKPKKQKSKEPTETQKIIAEQQCKLVFNRLVNTMTSSPEINQISLRNAMQRFCGSCDIEKLIPMMNIVNPQAENKKTSLKMEDFRQIYKFVQKKK